MNKHQKLVSRVFKVYFPLAVKHGGLDENKRKREYRTVKWSHSLDTLDEIRESLIGYRKMRDKIENNLE